MNYKKQRFKNITWLPFKLIKQATDEGWLQTLIYFVQLRKVHAKPIFYSYSLRKLSEPLKCSPTTLSYHIKIMAENGLISLINGNLLLIGSTKLRNTYKSNLIPVKYSPNRTDQLNLLRYSLIKNNLHQQYKAVGEKKDTINMHKSTSLKLIKKVLKKHDSLQAVATSINDKLVLSNKKVGSICNRSPSTGMKIQKALNKLRVVKTKRNVQLVSTERYDRRAFFEMCLPPNYLLSRQGLIYLSRPNEWAIRCIQ